MHYVRVLFLVMICSLLQWGCAITPDPKLICTKQGSVVDRRCLWSVNNLCNEWRYNVVQGCQQHECPMGLERWSEATRCVPVEPRAEYRVTAHIGKIGTRLTIPASWTAAQIGYNGRTPVMQAARELSPAYYMYHVLLTGSVDSEVRVASRGEFQSGTCVEVLVREPKPGLAAYPYGEAALKKSSRCQ